MATEVFDVIVIGGGSAGFSAARVAAGEGVRTLVIEGGEEIGGLCILRGCMPSKSLIESARRWYEIRHAADFGLEVAPGHAHLDQIVARKNKLIADFASYRVQQLERGKFTFMRGLARFIDDFHLEVKLHDGSVTTVEGKTFIIATGSVISHPPVPGLEETGYLTSDTAQNATTLPPSLAVLGGGVIACELGQYFAQLGSVVTIVQRSLHLVKELDLDISEELRRSFQHDGINVLTGTKLEGIERAANGKKLIHLQVDREARVLEVDEILSAMGREPAIASLDLAKPGVKIDTKKKRIDTALTTCTSVPHIFAAGDVTGHYEIVHIAVAQGEIAGHNAVRYVREGAAAEKDYKAIDYRTITSVVFTHPELASVGMSEREARAAGIEYLVGSYPFNDHGKSIIMGEKFGFVKLLAEKTKGEIIGAHVMGPHASDLIHELIAVMHFHGTVRDLMEMPHYHPTLAEIWTYPAEEIAAKLGT